MTGFGAVDIENESASIHVEIKTLNSKYSDANLKLPNLFSSKDIEARNMLTNGLGRGKVNMLVTYNSKGAANKLKVNQEVVSNYYQELKSTADQLGTSDADIFRMVMLMPDVYHNEIASDAVEEGWVGVKEAIAKAIDACNEFRRQEGAALEKELRGYIGNIQESLRKVEERDPERVKRIKEKLHQQVQDFVESDHFDSNRFEQELIYYIEKLDISEEKVRLKNHLSFFSETLDSANSNGKKLGFIGQEIGREINTIGSKANDAEIQRLVVGMKEELEKIKEQVLNVL